eukprot:363400-Chlamydomonas_euryale.AAC.9
MSTQMVILLSAPRPPRVASFASMHTHMMTFASSPLALCFARLALLGLRETPREPSCGSCPEGDVDSSDAWKRLPTPFIERTTA